jgi:hypothetical protein
MHLDRHPVADLELVDRRPELHPTRWLGAGGQGGFSVVGNTVTLEAIGGGQPSQMIVPFQTNGGVYSNVNNGFDNFEPYTIGPATFGLNLSGVTANTTITSAIFSFGTGPDTFLPGTSVPEPASSRDLRHSSRRLGTARAATAQTQRLNGYPLRCSSAAAAHPARAVRADGP